jgi:hypothetical protein
MMVMTTSRPVKGAKNTGECCKKNRFRTLKNKTFIVNYQDKFYELSLKFNVLLL